MRLNEAHRVMAAGMCSLVLTVGVARFAYTPLLPAMQAQAGLSDVAGGWLATLNYAGYMAGTVLAVALTDPALKHRLYRTGLLVAVLTTAGMGLTGSTVAWAVLRFAAGLSSAAGMLLGSSLVLGWLVRHGRRAELGIHFAGMGLGMVATGLVVALTVGTFDWAGQWLLMAMLGVTLLVPAWTWMPAPFGSGAASMGCQDATALPARRWMGLLTAAYFCGGFGYVVSATFLVAVVERQPGLAGSGGAVWMVAGLAAIPACAVWDRIARRIGEVPSLMLAYVAQIASILMPVLDDSFGLAVLAAALYGATFIGIVGLTLALVGRRCPANPARAMARLTLSYGAAQVLAPALAGGIAGATGSYKGALCLAAAVMAAGLMLLAILRRCGGGTADAPHRAAGLPAQNSFQPMPKPSGTAATTGHPHP